MNRTARRAASVAISCLVLLAASLLVFLDGDGEVADRGATTVLRNEVNAGPAAVRVAPPDLGEARRIPLTTSTAPDEADTAAAAPEPQIHGSVVDAEGRGVAGAELRILGFADRAWTGQDGTFSLDAAGVSAQSLLVAFHPSFRQGVHRLDEAETRGADPVILMLQAGRTLVFTVRDTAGLPVRGAQAIVHPGKALARPTRVRGSDEDRLAYLAHMAAGSGSVLFGESSEDGSVSIGGIDADIVSLVVECTGFEPRVVSGLAITSSIERIDDVVLTRGLVVSGRVLAWSGELVEGALVSLSCGSASTEGRSSPYGEFRVSGLPAVCEQFTVTVTHSEYSAYSTEHSSSSQLGDIVLEDLRTLHVRVTDGATGDLVGGDIHFTIQFAGQMPLIGTLASEFDGEHDENAYVSVGPFDRSASTVTVAAPGYQTSTLDLRAGSWVTADFGDVVVFPGGGLIVVVRDAATNELISGATLIVSAIVGSADTELSVTHSTLTTAEGPAEGEYLVGSRLLPYEASVRLFAKAPGYETSNGLSFKEAFQGGLRDLDTVTIYMSRK